jgi:hypothetical protein
VTFSLADGICIFGRARPWEPVAATAPLRSTELSLIRSATQTSRGCTATYASPWRRFIASTR